MPDITFEISSIALSLSDFDIRFFTSVSKFITLSVFPELFLFCAYSVDAKTALLNIKINSSIFIFIKSPINITQKNN